MHNEWQSFLQQQSANIKDDLVTDFGKPGKEQIRAPERNIIADLSHLDVLGISGKDATEFLQGQLSSDVDALAVNEWQLSSWCNIKGRVIASFLLFRSQDAFYLLLEKELSDSLVKRLQMFVMRAEVSITNRSDELMRIGIRGESAQAAVQEFVESTGRDSGISILPMRDSIPRSIVLAPLQQAQILWPKISTQAIAVGTSHWSLYDIQAGIAWIGKMGCEEFLPQSLNLDLCGGLSFDKGCYPGQEIIARMHFRGKLKQRLFLAEVSVNELPGIKTKLYTATAKQHVGMVVNAAMQANDSCLSLVTLELKYRDENTIHIGTEDGPELTLLALPYAIESDG